FSGSAAARACPQPRVQKEGNGLRNPRVAGHPAAYSPFVHSQAPGRLHLAQVQPAEGIAELLRRHGHNAVGKVPVARSQGKLPQPPAGSALSSRAICPRLPVRCLIISQARRHGTSAGRSDSWRSSKTTCAPRRRASWSGKTRWGWSWRRAAGCGSLPPRLGRPSVLAIGGFDNSCSSGGLSLKGWSWSASPRRSCSDCSPDPYEASYDWSSRSEGSSGESLREISQRPVAHDSVGEPAVR